MTAIDAEAVYAAGGPTALRLTVRGAVKQRQREGREADTLEEVAVPLTRLANRLREEGQSAEANAMLEHAVHDGVRAVVLAEAIQVATAGDILNRPGPPLPPAATDLDSAIELANALRARLLSL